MNKNTQSRPKLGFTLIETLLGVSIASSILILIASVTISLLTTRTRLNQLSQLQDDTSRIILTIKDDIRWASDLQQVVTYTASPSNNIILQTQHTPQISYSLVPSNGNLTRNGQWINPFTPISNLNINIDQRDGYLSLVTISFTITSRDNPNLSLTPTFTVTQLRTRYGPQ